MVLLQIKSKSFNSPYILHSILGLTVQDQITAGGGAGSTVSNLRIPVLKQIKIPIPPLPEQRAIASALSDTDDLIAALEALIAKKQAIKQGAMQELLTGRKRLPGFKGEWEEKRLGDIAEICKGQVITEGSAKRGTIPVIAGGKSPAYYHDTPNRPANCVTISASGANAGYVAFYRYPIWASDSSTIQPAKNYDVEYIYWSLKERQEQIYDLQTGGAQPHVQPSDLAPLMIGLPNLGEQQAIASILSDMDSEIAQLEDQLSKTRALKQGMMQELLTGKIRLVHGGKYVITNI